MTFIPQRILGNPPTHTSVAILAQGASLHPRRSRWRAALNISDMAAQGVVFTRADEEAAWKTLFDFLKADDGRPRWLPGMNLRRAALSYHARAAGPAPEVIAMGSLSFHLWRAVARHGRTATRDFFYHWRTVRHLRPQEAAAGSRKAWS